MSRTERLMEFINEVANSPMTERRQRVRGRAASLWMRVVALGFLLGLALSAAVWVYDRWGAGLSSET